MLPTPRHCRLLALLALASGLLAFWSIPGARADLCQCKYGRAGGISPWASQIRKTNPISVSEYPLHNATAMWDIPAMQGLLASKSVDVNGLDAEERTPLHVLFLTSSEPYTHPYTDSFYKVASLLLAAGAKPDIPLPRRVAIKGWRPLMWAANDGRYALVSMLLSSGADPNAKTARGNTALHKVAMCDYKQSWDTSAAATAAVLLNAGADPLAKNRDGKMPFDEVPGAGLSPPCDSSQTGDPHACPSTCKLLQAAQQAAQRMQNARPGGPLPTRLSTDPANAVKCCTDNSEADVSFCCI